MSSLITHHPYEVPEPALDHLIRLTDDTGLFQHAKFTVPNRAHGYCTDDNARGAIAMVRHYALCGDPRALKLLDTYLAFMMHAQNPDGTIRNFMEFNRRWWDDEPAHDGLGRTLWALGMVLSHPPSPAYLPVVKDCFDRATGHVQRQSNRGLAYCILGLCEYLKRFPGVGDIQQHIERAASTLIAQYHRISALSHDGAPWVESDHPSDWHWFEDSLTYDNAVLPHALFAAGRTLSNPQYVEIAAQATDFLLKITLHDDHFRFVGTRGWYERGKVRAVFDQQPVEAAAMVMMLRAAYDATRETKYLHFRQIALNWLLGANDLGVSLYDPRTKGCSDGLMSGGVNGNQGAESMVSFLLSLLSILEDHAPTVRVESPSSESLRPAPLHDGAAAMPLESRTISNRDIVASPDEF